jgi:hypothetical protein
MRSQDPTADKLPSHCQEIILPYLMLTLIRDTPPVNRNP